VTTSQYSVCFRSSTNACGCTFCGKHDGVNVRPVGAVRGRPETEPRQPTNRSPTTPSVGAGAGGCRATGGWSVRAKCMRIPTAQALLKSCFLLTSARQALTSRATRCREQGSRGTYPYLSTRSRGSVSAPIVCVNVLTAPPKKRDGVAARPLGANSATFCSISY